MVKNGIMVMIATFIEGLIFINIMDVEMNRQIRE